jgi:excisionase family DNA binding protein
MKRYMNDEEAVAYLGITYRMLRTLRESHRIDYVKHGQRTIRYPVESLDAYLAPLTVRAAN